MRKHSPAQSLQRRKNEKKEKKEALPHNLSSHKLPFSDNNYWLIPLIAGEEASGQKDFFVTFNHVLLAFCQKKIKGTGAPPKTTFAPLKF